MSEAHTGYLSFAYRDWRLLAFGFLMTFGSSFGQTCFVGVFSPRVEAVFSLSRTQWGPIYMIGTLASRSSCVEIMPLGTMLSSNSRRETELFADYRSIDRSMHWRCSADKRTR